ncbi:uncharacterized protein LOC133157272 isoform X2 [Syngnathus typhle]|uniref:uncharacterized protein LOC133157272 isoform X2 n=1 Tax=Syngnathus typhle TaxID=161592 RepID=UPI002A69E702|nr:uncharacterized protein LOC133157272 isoform X2 [Syngnathus typhle]
MTMQAAFFPFLLIAAHVSIAVDCKPRSKDPEELQLKQSSGTPSRRTHNYILPSAGSMRKRFLGHFLVVHPVKTHKRNYVSIFDLKRKRFVCMDLEGELYSFNARQLLLSHPKSSGLSSISPKRFLARLVSRQRRSEEVNPSDPLRSESQPSHSVNDHKESDHRQPEPDQTGAVSKETIPSSDDDPLKVLHANGPVSPVKTNIADRAEQE